ncbi:MAG TPA: hypothetical protein VGS19_36450 [Streptosporangiaceae bacterium]|nr:hypothetical protein [Streptosporangiaceae bacterium]
MRVYEPLSAFGEAERRRWSEYASSEDRPRRATALAAEQAEAMRRLIAVPPVPAPEGESRDAYVRWAEGVTYICPWQTRLRSWLALSRLRAMAPSLVRSAFPAGAAEAAVQDFASWQYQESSLRVYIQTSTWTVPFAWFLPFSTDERWLVLGAGGDPGEGGQMTAAGPRTLVYATTMARARERACWALDVMRDTPGWTASDVMVTGLEQLQRWLGEFHAQGLVELDYGGLVHLLDNDALCADQSVVEVTAAVGALATGEREFAAAMYQRFASRWRALEVLQRVN